MFYFCTCHHLLAFILVFNATKDEAKLLGYIELNCVRCNLSFTTFLFCVLHYALLHVIYQCFHENNIKPKNGKHRKHFVVSLLIEIKIVVPQVQNFKCNTHYVLHFVQFFFICLVSVIHILWFISGQKSK